MIGEIKFYLQADPLLLKEKPGSKVIIRSLRVIEYYRVQSYAPRKTSSGNMVYDSQSGHVDEGIRKANAKEYAKFRAFIEKNEDALYGAARAKPGEPIFFDYEPQPEEVKEVLLDEEVKPEEE